MLYMLILFCCLYCVPAVEKDSEVNKTLGYWHFVVGEILPAMTTTLFPVKPLYTI